MSHGRLINVNSIETGFGNYMRDEFFFFANSFARFILTRKQHVRAIMLGVVSLLGTFFLAVMPAHAQNIVGNVLVVRALDKVNARTRDFSVHVGEVLQYGSLDVYVRYCEKRPPEEIPEIYAFLEVIDRRLDGRGGEGAREQLFSGWMFASSPALSSLEHSVYDVWVLDCYLRKDTVEGYNDK